MKTVSGRRVEAALGSGLLTGKSASRPGPRSPLAGHPGRAYNSVSSFPGCKFPESSFERVVPRLLSSRTVTNLVLQSPTSDLTNLRSLLELQHQKLVKQSARNMVEILEKARTDNPSLRKVIILEQLPRTDRVVLSNLSKLYNNTLRELVAAAPSNSNCQMIVANHSSLDPTSEDMKSALFGPPSSRSTDEIHLRGSEGGRRYTCSVISALKSVGLGGWSVQSRRGGWQPAESPDPQRGGSNQYQVQYVKLLERRKIPSDSASYPSEYDNANDNDSQSASETTVETDISVQSDYLPYSNNNIPDNTHVEDEDNTHLEDDDNTQHEDDDNTQSEKNNSEPQPIQVVTSNRVQGWNNNMIIPKGWTTRINNVTIQRNNKGLLARMLPTVFVTNHRLFFPKFHNFVEAMKTFGLTLGLHSEIWEVKENKSHQNKLEEAL